MRRIVTTFCLVPLLVAGCYAQGDANACTSQPSTRAYFETPVAEQTMDEILANLVQCLPDDRAQTHAANIGANTDEATQNLLAALYRNTIFDRAANITTLSSISSPEFFMAYVLMLFLAFLNPIFPSLSNIYDGMPFGERLEKSMLPALTLTLVVTAHMMRMTRAAIINLLASPYIEMARLKGLSPMRVIVKHALPNALAPIINVIALNLAYLITGVVVVEVVFVYPGIGQLFVDSVKIRDIPVVQACCLIFAAAYILLNLTADVLSILSNPRLRHPK